MVKLTEAYVPLPTPLIFSLGSAERAREPIHVIHMNLLKSIFRLAKFRNRRIGTTNRAAQR